MALVVVTWYWGTKYDFYYTKRLHGGVARNLKQPFRFIVAKPQPQDDYLKKIPGCFVRMQMFGAQWREKHGIKDGDRVVNLDLDLVVTGPLDPLFDREEPFCILQDINTTNPCPYNGSVWMFRAGYKPDVWDDFSVENYHKLGVPFHSIPDDQGWFHYKMPDAGSYGPHNGVYGFKKRGWPSGDDLPQGARIVAFPGWRDPWKYTRLNWVRNNWR